MDFLQTKGLEERRRQNGTQMALPWSLCFKMLAKDDTFWSSRRSRSTVAPENPWRRRQGIEGGESDQVESYDKLGDNGHDLAADSPFLKIVSSADTVDRVTRDSNADRFPWSVARRGGLAPCAQRNMAVEAQQHEADMGTTCGGYPASASTRWVRWLPSRTRQTFLPGSLASCGGS